MTRHSKNNTDGAVFTYHERRKMRHGSARMRLPAAAMKPWHHCALGLAPVAVPVLTPHGVLYDREAVVLHLLRQKEHARNIRAAGAADDARDSREAAERAHAQRVTAERRFTDRQERIHVAEPHSADEQPRPAQPAIQSNFWLPAADDAQRAEPPVKRRKKDKLSSRTVCPVTGKPLKARDLITLKLTPNNTKTTQSPAQPESGSQAQPDANAPTLYMCPVCQTVLINSANPVALRTGTVLCARCVAQFVIKDARDPVCGTQLDVKVDIIPIENSGTAFAGSSADDPASKEAKLYRPSVR